MSKKKRKKKFRSYMYFFIRDKVWNTLLEENEVEPLYKGKIFQINFARNFLRIFRILQRFIYDKRINKIDLSNNQPIFVIGHWRSGTTHLHYVFHKDKQFGTLSNYQTFTFTTALLSKRLVKFFIAPFVPKERAQDNIKMTIDKPGEEEQSMAVMSTKTGIHSWIFPKNLSYFKKYNLFEGISKKEKKEWQEDYMYLLKNISFDNKQKRLLLKNPHNTSRVKELLELFPNAKFVFIHRNPFEIFISMVHLFAKVVETQYLQYATLSEREDFIIYLYKETMQKYLRDRELVPKGNLFELSFDEFTGKEMEFTERIYSDLSIPGFEEAKPGIQHYLDSVKTYKKNKFREISPEMKARILKEWDFAFKEWGY